MSSIQGRMVLNYLDTTKHGRRQREKLVYNSYDGLTRKIIAMKDELKMTKSGDSLLEYAVNCQETAQYAIKRIDWVNRDQFTWEDIEGSEKLQMKESVLQKHKSGTILEREDILRLMTEMRLEYLDERAKLRGVIPSNVMKSSSIDFYKSQASTLKSSLGVERRTKVRFTTTGSSTYKKRDSNGVLLHCSWCKKLEKTTQTGHHESNQCKHKPALRKRKRN